MSWSVALILVFAGILQWLLFAGISAFSRAAFPKKGMRTSERNLMISSAVLLGLWLVGFDVRALMRTQTSAPVAQASAVSASKTAGSCSSVMNDMPASEVQQILGEPDEKRSNDATRGPGAEIWVYRGSRCAVHIFEGQVEFIE